MALNTYKREKISKKEVKVEKKSLQQKKAHYDEVQVKKAILMKAFKIPPALQQFTVTLEGEEKQKVLDYFMKYQPETRKARKQRELSANPKEGPKPIITKFGIKHVVDLIERKVAKLVLIAADVDPIEVVVFIPTLCRKMNIPYAIIKNQRELGPLVHMKTATCAALCGHHPADRAEFDDICRKVNGIYLDNYENTMKTWGTNIKEEDAIVAVAEE